MATLDASLSSLALPPAPPCKEPSRWQPQPPEALRFLERCWGPARGCGLAEAPFCGLTGFGTRPSLGEEIGTVKTSGLGWFLSCWELVGGT